MSPLQSQHPECTIENNYTNDKQKKIERLSVDVFRDNCNAGFEAMGCFFSFLIMSRTSSYPLGKEMQR